MSREENSAQQETNLQGEALLEAYEREHLKCADLAARIADLEAKNEELEWKLNRIKKNPLWKASGPARKAVHWAVRQKD